MEKVGFIGLGQLGKAMALNLIGSFDLMVYDLRDEPRRELAAAGARIAASPGEIAKHAEIIEIAVVDDDQLEQVTIGEHGLIEAAMPASIIAVHSTVRPRTIIKIAERAERKGVKVIDAPVSGGEIGARERRLCYMAGGDRQVFDRCRKLFAASGGANVFYLGELGMGLKAKLCHQIISSVNRLSAHEGMSLARRAGLTTEDFKSVVHAGTAWSKAVDFWSEKELPAHHAEMLFKDLRLAIEMANEMDVALPFSALAQQWMQTAKAPR